MRILTTFLLFSISWTLSAQSTYWQQRVEYTINVELDDVKHMLMANEEFVYFNNSPQTLDFIYIHVWPNAYKDKNTALARQQYENGEAIIKYGSDDERGWIDSLDFKIDGNTANWEFHDHHIDIVKLKLNEPLSPGKSIKVSTPFRVKLPTGEISRLGHIEQSYQITQWYPKPAVFDKDGWHHMPYLNQGEFYSEYGSYDVSITLPKNYIVGATGDLQTDSEIAFLNDQASTSLSRLDSLPVRKKGAPNTFPPSEKETKTIRYIQDNVHDFAWFADKRFYVLKGEVELPHSGRKVTTWAMFTPKNSNLWKKAPEYLHDGVYYYSLWNGDYPYNNVTAVDGTISAGGGMEYPNVTVIGNASRASELEVVIVHEVGHNWFYGQLGTNERVHGWMDEGMNTLNEVRYMQTKYPNNTLMSDMVLNGKFHLDGLGHHDLSDMSYRAIAGFGEDQPVETHSNDFTSINYGVIMYQKTGLIFFYLKDYLGEELFDKCMRDYYATWEFKHPGPEDMRNSLEKSSGKDLGWLFDDLIQTTNHIDYKIGCVKHKNDNTSVTVKNVGQVDGPIEVVAFKNGEIVETQWVEPGAKKTKIQFNQAVDRISIDPDLDIPEMNRQNNSWKQKGLFGKFEKPKFEFLIGDNEEDRTNIFWTPIIGGNYYDKFMLGIGFHNFSIPYSKVNYLFMPYYSFGRRSASGIAEISVNSLPKKTFKTSKLGLSIKSFKHDTTYRYNDSYFLTISPFWMAKIGNRKATTPWSQHIRLQGMYRKDQFGPTHIDQAGAYLEYVLNFRKRDHKFEMKFRNEYIDNTKSSDEMARGLLEVSYSYRYKKEEGTRWLKKKQAYGNASKGWISIRAFLGKHYVSNYNTLTSPQYAMSLAGSNGSQDLFIDEYYFGRNLTSGMWSQQRQENMGGFKSTSNYGTSSDMIASANLYFQLPIKPSIFGLYADFGAAWNDITTGESMVSAINTGAAIRFGEVFAVYFPIWMSDGLNNSYVDLNYAKRIRFSLKMNLFREPLKLNGLF